jgi:hypothetical protein
LLGAPESPLLHLRSEQRRMAQGLRVSNNRQNPIGGIAYAIGDVPVP